MRTRFEKEGKPKEFLTRAEIKEMILNDITKPVTKALSATLYCTGSRISEICGGALVTEPVIVQMTSSFASSLSFTKCCG